MRILHSPDISVPAAGVPAASPADQERVEAVEHIAKSILQKLQGIEERIKALEETAANSSSPAEAGGGSISHNGPPTETFGGDDKTKPVSVSVSVPTISPIPITLDADLVKKGLLTKMWKYLNDEAAA